MPGAHAMKQIPLAIGPEPQPTFDNFVPGANAAAVQHLQGLAWPAAPVYLWGPAGSGKTHLLRALAGRCQAAGGRVGWYDAAQALPWTPPSDAAIVVIDRCEALGAEAQFPRGFLLHRGGGKRWRGAALSVAFFDFFNHQLAAGCLTQRIFRSRGQSLSVEVELV